MNVVLWILQGLLAAVFLFAGSNKALRPKDALAGQLAWVEDFSPNTVKLIGTAVTHVRRKENQMVVANAVLFVLLAVVAWGRFGPYS